MSENIERKANIRLINAVMLLDIMDATTKHILRSDIPYWEKETIQKIYPIYRECVNKAPTFPRGE